MEFIPRIGSARLSEHIQLQQCLDSIRMVYFANAYFQHGEERMSGFTITYSLESVGFHIARRGCTGCTRVVKPWDQFCCKWSKLESTGFCWFQISRQDLWCAVSGAARWSEMVCEEIIEGIDAVFTTLSTTFTRLNSLPGQSMPECQVYECRYWYDLGKKESEGMQTRLCPALEVNNWLELLIAEIKDVVDSISEEDELRWDIPSTQKRTMFEAEAGAFPCAKAPGLCHDYLRVKCRQRMFVANCAIHFVGK